MSAERNGEPGRPALVVAVAPNGARRTRTDHPALPITPPELADCAASCREAGAAMIHLHVRDANGGHSLSASDYRPAIDAVRRAVGDSLVLQLTTEAAGTYERGQQMALVRELKPEAVSLALREILPDASAETESARFLAWMERERIVPQYILYTPGDITRYAALCRREIVPTGRHWVLFVLGRYAADQRSSLADLLPMLAAWQAEADVTALVPWATCAFGPRESECALGAAALGGHVRLGFENNLHMPDGRMARDNAEVIAGFVRLARALGHAISDAQGLRQMLA